MKLFETAFENFKFMGMEWVESTQTFKYSIERHFYSFLAGSICFHCTFFYLIFDAKSFVEYTEALFLLSTDIMCGIITLFLVIRLDVLAEIATIIINAANERLKCPESKQKYHELIERIEKWSKILVLVQKVTIPCGLLSRALPSFFFYFATDIGSEAFMLPVPMWFPFDWKTPIGYLIVVLIQACLGFYVGVFISALTTFALGTFLFSNALTKDMNKVLHNINKCAKDKENSTTIKDHLVEFIDIHTTIQQMTIYFSEAYQPTIATLFTWSLITISGTMLMIQLQISHHETDFFEISVMILEAVCAFGLVGFTCEIGQMSVNQYYGVNDELDQLSWYRLPIEVKRMLPFITLIAQQELAIECFGSVLCVRESFKSVIKTAYSYWSVLREFDF